MITNHELHLARAMKLPDSSTMLAITYGIIFIFQNIDIHLHRLEFH